MNLFDLMPPHSIEAEQSVLGGLMLDNEAWELIADIIGPDDFFKHEHRLIFKAIETLAAATKPFDVVTVSESLAQIDEAGGLAYLAELAKNVPSVANISAYAEIVRERAHLRQLIMLGHECSRNASSDQAKSLEVQESFEQKLFALGQGRAPNSFVNVNDALMRVLEQVDFNFNHGDGVTGVPSGLADLDQKTGGFQDSDLIIVAARPSMGKTSLALNFVDAVLQKCPTQSVQIYSLEMPAQALMYRMLAILGQLDLANLMRGQLEDEDWSRLTAAVARINAYGERLVVDDSSDLTPATLRARARRAARRYGKPSLIMVDYLQLMQCPGKENRNLEIAAISAGLKALAKEFDCPVVALSQLNRSLENRPNKRPHNGDLRESGALEQDADLTLFIYRDEVYHPDSIDQGVAELIIGKHRNGPNRLTPLERNAWHVFRLLLNDDGLTSFPTYEQLRPYLASSPYKLASRETVAKALTALRLTRWLSLAGRVRDEVTGQMKGNIYLLHDEPISISEAMLLDSSYLQLLGNSQDHANKSIRQVAANTLEEFMQDPHLRDHTLPSHLEVLGRRVANQEWAKAHVEPSTQETPSSDASHESELSQNESELSKKSPVRNRAAPSSESEPSRKQGSAPRVRNPNSSSTSTYTNTSVCKSSVPRESPGAVIKWPGSFESLAPDQRRKVQVGLGLVSAEVQQSVLDQWDTRLGQGQMRNPFGYLLGMIERARNGEFNVIGQVGGDGEGRFVSGASVVPRVADAVRESVAVSRPHQPTELSRSVANKELAAIMAMMGKRGVGVEEGRTMSGEGGDYAVG